MLTVSFQSYSGNKLNICLLLQSTVVAFVCVTTIEIKNAYGKLCLCGLKLVRRHTDIQDRYKENPLLVLVHIASVEQFPRCPMHSPTSEKSSCLRTTNVY